MLPPGSTNIVLSVPQEARVLWLMVGGTLSGAFLQRMGALPHRIMKQGTLPSQLNLAKYIVQATVRIAASEDASTIVVNYSNTASAGWNGDNSTMPTSSGSHSFDASMLDKTALFLQSSGSKVSYTIEMNPYGLDLSDDDIIRLEDNMGDGKDVFAYVASSFKVVNLDTGAQLKADSTASATTYAVTMDEDGKGFSLVEVVSACPTNWGMTPQKALEWVESDMLPYYPIGVYKDRTAAKEEK